MWLLTAAVYRFGNIRPDFSRRRNAALPIVLVIGGGFLINVLWGPATITRAMTSAGYGRCPSRDHVAGNGKSRVWFAGYVRAGGACPNGK
jgi:hypothetical protein